MVIFDGSNEKNISPEESKSNLDRITNTTLEGIRIMSRTVEGMNLQV